MKQILKSIYQNSRNKYIKKLILDSFNKNYNVRYSIARNKEIPIPVLEKLSNDENWEVRLAVARNKNSPIPTLDKLSNDTDLDVRAAVAENLNDKKSINKNSFLDYLKGLFYNLFKKKKKRG